MKTISVSALKAHLSAELRTVKAGEQILGVEHRHPVALEFAAALGFGCPFRTE